MKMHNLLLGIPVALGASVASANGMYENTTYTYAQVYETGNNYGERAYDDHPTQSAAADGGYSASAWATPYSLGAGAFAVDTPEYTGNAYSWAQFTTYFNVTNTGSLSIPVLFDGQLSASADAYAYFSFYANVSNANDCGYCSDMKMGGGNLDSVDFKASFGGFDLTFTIDESDSLDFYVEEGDVIGISFSLNTGANWYGENGGGVPLVAEGFDFTPNYVAYADFLSTATLDLGGATGTGSIAPVPVPAAVWLFGSALLGIFGFNRRRTAAS